MAKKKKLMKLAESRPKTSCYTSPPATLRVGQDLRSYYVPEFFLQSLKDHSSPGSNGTTIDLIDVDTGTGHVFAHFLHTGTYQTLADGKKFTSSARATTEFQKAILAFVAAQKYGLTALQDLAKGEAVQWGDMINIVEAIEAVNEDKLLLFTDNTVWFRNLILLKADQAFHEDGSTLFTADFFNNIKNSKLAKMLAQRITDHYLERVSVLRQVISTFENGLTAPVECVVKDTQGEPLVAPSNDLVQPHVLHWDHSVDHSAIAPSEAGACQPSGSDNSLAREPELEPGITDGHILNDPDSTSGVVDTAIDDAPSRVGYAAEEVAWEIISSANSQEKENSSTAPIEESGPILSVDSASEPLVAEDGDRGNSAVLANKKKKKKKRAVEEELLASETIAALCVEPKTEAFLPSVSENLPDAPVIDPFAGLSKSQKKKLEKRMKEEAAMKERAEFEQQTINGSELSALKTTHEAPATDVFAGLNKSQRRKLEKKMKDEAEIEAPLSTVPLSEPGFTTVEDLIMPESGIETEVAPPVNEEYPPDSGITLNESHNDDCPLRYEHLSKTGVWSECGQCELYVRGIAVKLCSEGSLIEGLEVR